MFELVATRIVIETVPGLIRMVNPDTLRITQDCTILILGLAILGIKMRI